MDKSVMSYFSLNQLVNEVIKRTRDTDGAEFLSLWQLKELIIICSLEVADRGHARTINGRPDSRRQHGFNEQNFV